MLGENKVIALLHLHRFEITSMLWVFIGILVGGWVCDKHKARCRTSSISINMENLQGFAYFMLSVVAWPIFILAYGVEHVARKSGEEIEGP